MSGTLPPVLICLHREHRNIFLYVTDLVQYTSKTCGYYGHSSEENEKNEFLCM
jgi:hypothetical protein